MHDQAQLKGLDLASCGPERHSFGITKFELQVLIRTKYPDIARCWKIDRSTVLSPLAKALD